MKYFIDSEFLEGTQDTGWGFRSKPTIDLISIGIVAEDGRKYYAISKDFNLKEAWNRYDLVDICCNDVFSNRKYWIRDNVLKLIFKELAMSLYRNDKHRRFTQKNFKCLVKKYGKTNKQIAKEIIKFISPVQNMIESIPKHMAFPEHTKTDYNKPEFYKTRQRKPQNL
jgi:hypothetical protein